MTNRPVWTEGMFLRPQHFQQQTRWTESHARALSAPLSTHPWGFTRLAVEREGLALGRFALREVAAVFPDGLAIDAPHVDDLPGPLVLDEQMRDETLYLAVPARRPASAEFDRDPSPLSLARFVFAEVEQRDTVMNGSDPIPLEVARPRLRLMRHSEPRDDYICIQVARAVEVRPDRGLVLDPEYIPPVLGIGCSEVLQGVVQELFGLLVQRGEAVAGRLAGSDVGAGGELVDFLMLMVVNRFQPQLGQFTESPTLHPFWLHSSLLALAGELSTLTTIQRRPLDYPRYRHDDLDLTFRPLVDDLRRAFAWVGERRAVLIPIADKGRGYRLARVEDRNLFDGCAFVLAVRCALPPEQVRRDFPLQMKIGPVEKIGEFVQYNLPGVDLEAMGAAPRELPYHTGTVYFEINRRSEFWRLLPASGAIAMHVGDKFPDLSLELWAIREA